MPGSTLCDESRDMPTVGASDLCPYYTAESYNPLSSCMAATGWHGTREGARFPVKLREGVGVGRGGIILVLLQLGTTIRQSLRLLSALNADSRGRATYT